MSVMVRTSLRSGDPAGIEQLVRETGFFSAEEITIARELANDGLALGTASHYRFALVDSGPQLAAYACYGRIPCTRSAWDLYWIAVAPRFQGQHLGRGLLEHIESAVISAGGTQLHADTSSRAQYGPTRAFYAARGYRQAAEFPDFYCPGDGKIVFSKALGLAGG
ncbi:MAG: GNAT family N-acetyltransferase [Gammaproteobacteria bacterium]